MDEYVPEGQKVVTGPSFDYASNPASTTKSVSKVFGIMFLALLATAIVTGLFAFMDWSILGCSYGSSGEVIINNPGNNTILVVLGVISMVGIIVFSIMAGAFANKNSTKPTFASSHSVLFPFIGFGVCMSYYLGLLVLVCPWQALLCAFLVTIIIFGVMSLIGLCLKGKGGIILLMTLSALSGIGLIFAFASLFTLFFPGISYTMMLIVSGIMFGLIMIITIIDVMNIKNIAIRGGGNSNLLLYCAFSLYVDFIVIFLRVLYFILLIYGRSR